MCVCACVCACVCVCVCACACECVWVCVYENMCALMERKNSALDGWRGSVRVNAGFIVHVSTKEKRGERPSTVCWSRSGRRAYSEQHIPQLREGEFNVIETHEKRT